MPRPWRSTRRRTSVLRRSVGGVRRRDLFLRRRAGLCDAAFDRRDELRAEGLRLGAPDAEDLAEGGEGARLFRGHVGERPVGKYDEGGNATLDRKSVV